MPILEGFRENNHFLFLSFIEKENDYFFEKECKMHKRIRINGKSKKVIIDVISFMQ